MLRAIALLWLFCAAALAQSAPVLVQNLASAPQDGWVFVGLPEAEQPKADAGWLRADADAFPWVRETGGIRVWVSMDKGPSLRKLFFVDKARDPGPFVFHPAIEADVLGIAPRFFLGETELPQPSLDLVRASAAAQVWHFRTHLAAQRITVDCWATVYSGEPTIEWTTHAVYGTVANTGQPQSVVLPALTMRSNARPHPDFWSRNGQQWAQWVQGIGWVQPLVDANTRWHRASRFESRGVLMPVPDPTRMEGKPVCGLYAGWDGHWMALGRVPQRTADVTGARRAQLDAYFSTQWGSYSQNRPRAQMQTSGTTGDQPDFGWASDIAVTAGEPWEIHDALWQCQSFAQRPTANKEADGSPMLARRHPDAETLNQRPDLGWGPADRLGWPGVNQIAWIPSPDTVLWTTGDDQHRADNLLHATIALTRDPALESIVRDHIELDRTDFYVKRNLPPSPRAIGRLALTRANQVWLGFADAAPTLRNALDAAARRWPVGTDPQVEEAKYGWANLDGSPVMGWQPWQKTIEMGGFLAAGRVLGEPRYTAAAEKIAETMVAHAYLQKGAAYWHAYAIRWNGGTLFPATSWPASLNRDAEGFTSDIYVSSAAASWTIGAAIVAAASEKGNSTAKLVIEAQGKPRNISESRWRALR